jgi:hypothetical protein
MTSPCARPAAGRTLSACWLLGLSLAALAAQGQTAVRPARPDPLDPKARVPVLSYESPFKAYRRPGDDKPVSWRDANDTVTRIGGWRVYAREAQQPDPAPAAATSSPATPGRPAP